MNKAKYINLINRALWTFVQASLGALTSPPVASVFGLNIDLDAVDAALIGGIGAVLSLIKTFASDQLGTGTAADPPKGSINAAGEGPIVPGV